MHIPIGLIALFGATPPPAGWIEAGGQAISRTHYADLFRVYGVTYGPGDGSTTFNVPDIRGRCAVGPNTMGGHTEPRVSFATTIGATGGAENVLLQGNASGSGTGEQGSAGLIAGGGIAAGNDFENNVSISEAESPHNNVQPTIIIPFCIYAGV